MGFATALFLVIVLTSFFNCRPFAYNWNRTLDGVCGDINTSYLIQASINLCIDVTIVILPIPGLSKLQLPFLKKLGVYFMFSVGIG